MNLLRAVMSRRRVLAGALAFWTIPALLMTAGLVARGETTTVPRAFLAEGLSWYYWALAAPVIFELVHRIPIEGARWGRKLGLHLLAAILMGMIHALVAAGLYFSFGNSTSESSSLLGFLVWTPFGILFYGATASVGFALEYYQRLRERELHASRMETLLLESRLGALRMQLQPHFLFNALNTVAMLVRQGDQQTSVRVLARLSDLLREILSEERGAEVSLQEELEFIDRYLEIEEIRFGDRLRIEMEVDDRAKSARVPGLLLQPLVENSIRHAIARKAASGWIRLEAAAINGSLQLTLSDDGPGFPPGFRVDQSNGIGLRNTLARLDYLYGDAASLKTGQSQHGGAEVRITIPITAEHP